LVIGRRLRLTAALAGWAVVAAAPAAALDCRLALVLGMDVSSSVDATEDRLQRQGLARALVAPEVEAALFAVPLPVALAVYEWSGRYNQEVLLDWTLLNGRSDLQRASAAIAGSQRSHDDFPTAMGHALAFAAGLLARAPACIAQTVDIAGDGQNNDGYPPSSAYKAFPFERVTVNGLVVNGGEFEAEVGLIAFFRRELLNGPGAFLEIADGFEDYERAMRRKLEREVSAAIIGALPPPSGQSDGG
jgi:hypothetical protein